MFSGLRADCFSHIRVGNELLEYHQIPRLDVAIWFIKKSPWIFLLTEVLAQHEGTDLGVVLKYGRFQQLGQDLITTSWLKVDELEEALEKSGLVPEIILDNKLSASLE
jgi:hypothetical protein